MRKLLRKTPQRVSAVALNPVDQLRPGGRGKIRPGGSPKSLAED